MVFELAKDHFAYIGIYRDAIDQLQQLTHELWIIVMDDKSSQSDKTAVIKEIHNIEKSKVLLLRDLPYITRLSKLYDLTLFGNSLSVKSDFQTMNNKPKPIPNLEKDHDERYKDITDYIIIHELCHLKIKGHSYQFCHYLKQIVPEYRQKIDWLARNTDKISHN